MDTVSVIVKIPKNVYAKLLDHMQETCGQSRASGPTRPWAELAEHVDAESAPERPKQNPPRGGGGGAAVRP